ncbi:MAG: hypothetical protein CVV64_02035 [Candidatus Wallbacteria bacterium HGW-Wallbacteria-1]|jgi:tetratricopeptide (TPR) repeat protein|uniref:Uncharacterized protein n=1 Tax=Candidatus Wallbacteria bacterium HGW-Wallbacteria-1 TaxID=2013854 RepID=A0A2N1PV45_9BACT|nr:MAG: hypothetical protein CVV64_02035 [Candidatus Wallbacteria bacterium HGW-Wallbacteria-1]
MIRNPEILVLVLDKGTLGKLRKSGMLIVEEPPNSKEPLYIGVFIEKKTSMELGSLFRVRAVARDDSSTMVSYTVSREMKLPFKMQIQRPKDPTLVPIRYITFADLFDPALDSKFFITAEKAIEMMKMTIVFIRLDSAMAEEMGLPEMIPLLEEDYRSFSERSDGMLNVDIIIRGMSFVMDHDPDFEEVPLYSDFIVNVRTEEARAHLEEGRISEAMETIFSAMRIAPENAALHFFLGNVYFERQQFDKSLEAYDQTLKFDPGFREALNNKGICLVAMDRLDDAIAIWEKSLKLPGGKDDPILLVNLGKAYIAQGDLKLAEKFLRKSVKLKPGNRFARNYLAVVLANTDRLKEAAKVWQSLLADGIYNPSVAVNLARCLVATGKPEEAYPLFFDIVFDDGTADPSSRRVAAQGLKDLSAHLLHELGGLSPADAVKVCDFTLSCLLRHGVHVKGFGKLTKKFRKEMETLLLALDEANARVTEIRFGDFPEGGEMVFKYTELPFGGRISLASEKGVSDLLKKRDMLDELLKGSSESSSSAVSQSQEDSPAEEDVDEDEPEVLPEDKTRNLERLLKAVKDEPDNEWAHYQLATALADAGRTKDALDHFGKAAIINPDNAIAHHAMGSVLTRLGRFSEAVKCFQHAIIATPDDELSKLYEKWNYRDSLAYFDLGEVYMRMEMLEESIEMFKKGLGVDARVPLAHFHLGLCYGMNSDYELSEESFRNAILLDSGFGPAHTRLGIALYHQEKLDEAVASFSRALELNAMDMEAMFMLGQTYARKGSLTQAIECFRSVSRIGKGSDIARASETRIVELMGGDQ